MNHFWGVIAKFAILLTVLCLLASSAGVAFADGGQRTVQLVFSTTSPASTDLLNATDILFNGGLETGSSTPLGWQNDAWVLPYSTFEWKTDFVHSGTRSIKITSTTANDARWIQTVYVQPNSDYRLSGWIMTDNVAHSSDGVDAGANLSLLNDTFTFTSPLFGNNPWTFVSLDFNSGASTQVTIGARLGMYSGTTTGLAWFDDLKLELLSAPTCYTLPGNVQPPGAGSINIEPLPNCNNGTQYVHGTVVKLTSTPNTNYSFDSWTGDLNGSRNPEYLTMTSNKSVTAKFGAPGTLTVSKSGTGSGTVTSSPGGIVCGPDCSKQYPNTTQVALTASPSSGSVFAGWSGGGCSGVGTCTVTIGAAVTVTASFTKALQNPQWKILVLIYTSSDFTYGDGTGQHHVVAEMTQSEIDRATTAANRFVQTDIPLLTSGNMLPLITIRQPNHPLSSLDPLCGYWPSPSNTSADLDPAFDSVIVIWDDTGTDLSSGQPADLNCYGGLALSNGIGQTYSTFPIDSVASNQRNVFKHEWGHSILFYFDAAGLSPLPTVDNHINDTTIKYVHCATATPYILQDESDDNPILNSIYNNDVGFTHDYYSGTTAKPENPNHCLGITPSAWSFGGPVTKPSVKPQHFTDVPTTHPYYSDIEILYTNGLTAGCSTSPLKFCPDQIMNRGESAVFMLRANFGSSFLPTPPTHILKDDWTKGSWAEPWAEAMYFNGLSAGCSSSPLKYCPWDQIPREQAVIFALRMKYGTNYIPPAATGTLFADLTDVNYYATSWAEQAYRDGLIPSCGASGGKPKICPKSLVSRGLGAYMIVRAKNLSMP
jgi:hypothetical protein